MADLPPSVLVANRGEIACRIIRTAQRLGIRTIAVHSDADAGALFVEMADEAHRLGPAPAAESYLRIDRILEVAEATGAACVHPGYGFLSERAEFAEACAEAGIIFVGPPAAAIRAMGLKDAAKALVARAGVPVVPGYHGAEQDPEVLRQEANSVGYPVLIKAVAGGGGKGMRRVEREAEFLDALQGARREATAAFGDPRVLVEKYVLSPRHVEMQVFADAHGHVVHLFERDCSLQRRHQKVIEEAPAPGMSPETREAMGRAAIEAARAVGYVGAGTVEFIADGRDGLRPDRFWFMEMNTRLQVEHPVTEAITGLDLVELQFRVAAGGRLPFLQEDVRADGHAVEARLYAEDPAAGFLPSTGRLWALDLAEGNGVRIDSGVRAGDDVSPYYDPMIAKVIVHAGDRGAALDRLSQALSETVVAGPRTNVALLRRLADAEAFRRADFDTGFIERNLEQLGVAAAPLDASMVAAGAVHLVRRAQARLAAATSLRQGARPGPWRVTDGFQLVGASSRGLLVTADGETLELRVEFDAKGPRVAGASEDCTLVEAEEEVLVLRDGRQIRVALHDPFDVDLERLDQEGAVKAPMHGRVVAVFVEPGDLVEKGQRLAVVEAMKMEHTLVAPAPGEVIEVAVEVGAQVAEGARVVALKGVSDE
ncbi:biotin carboxylase N-terminal domain-containing protein [Lutibaculum baratangense]|uniref:Methylcrotonyl-CoA carboxylase biotin-containing subunit n=1 Tax=Lutibaculum baratangense AMV1 TaxID=631454 RepID=V4RIA0_9HYPH|nr:biotin carboxylase N-terminal domain-containing protein [Lutibaculum baratangense]ESR22995.1 Methylcrotonyl-CoA carboxylase biotin-containing subunit [Lutibaculum baratangense AMV1]